MFPPIFLDNKRKFKIMENVKKEWKYTQIA